MAGLAAKPGLWLSLAALAIVPVAGGIAVKPAAIYRRLSSLLGIRQPGGYWRLLALILALLNLKSLPFAWHFRLTYALLQHVSLFRSRCPPAPPLPSLFTPLITRTRCSLLEMDYNLHKSNSTYFSDLDISRMHLVSCLFKRGLHKLHFKTSDPLLSDQKPGHFGIYFGGVQCSFRREIKPGQNVEIWSRVLTWDRKWLYLVSHFVEADREKPKGYWLQPWKKGSSSKGTEANGTAGAAKTPKKAILATAISKYVFKQGRITIPPELALQGAELLPPKPTGAAETLATLANSGAPSAESTQTSIASDTIATKADNAASSSPETVEDLELGPPLDIALENWTWEVVEKERQRGLKLAVHMSALDDAALVWSGADGMALGEF